MPVRVGVVSPVIWDVTVGTAGAMVSMINSPEVRSLRTAPVLSVTLAVTLYWPCGMALPLGTVSDQVSLSPSTRPLAVV